jgi:hypothetical protein
MKDKGTCGCQRPGGGPYPQNLGSATAAPLRLAEPLQTYIHEWQRQGPSGSEAGLLGVGAPTWPRATRSAFILHPSSFILFLCPI